MAKDNYSAAQLVDTYWNGNDLYAEVPIRAESAGGAVGQLVGQGFLNRNGDINYSLTPKGRNWTRDRHGRTIGDADWKIGDK